MELVLTWKKLVVGIVLAAAGVAVYCRFFRGLPSMGTDGLFAEHMNGNPVAKHLLKKRKAEHSVSDVKEYLSHRRPDVRELAAELLGRPGDTAALDALSASVSDPSPQVRARVAKSLAEIDERNEVVPMLASMLDDEDPGVQVAVSRALKAATGERSVHGVERWKGWWDIHKNEY